MTLFYIKKHIECFGLDPHVKSKIERWALMTVFRNLGIYAEWLARLAYANLPVPHLQQPSFIIGCGRSGTTILGRTLREHSDVVYLNEPRHIWVDAYPQIDVWSSKAPQRQGQLVMKARDATSSQTRKIKRGLHFKTVTHKGTHLLEKEPAASFRLPFLHHLFPGFRLIHLFRNGLEVARSIEQYAQRYPWFGVNDYKWYCLVAIAQANERTYHLPDLCASNFDRGLLEWRLNTEHALSYLRHLPDEVYYELNYSDFLTNGTTRIREMQAFLGLAPDDRVEHFLKNQVSRKSDPVDPDSLPARIHEIGGPLLKQMLENPDTQKLGKN